MRIYQHSTKYTRLLKSPQLEGRLNEPCVLDKLHCYKPRRPVMQLNNCIRQRLSGRAFYLWKESKSFVLDICFITIYMQFDIDNWERLGLSPQTKMSVM